MEFADRHSSFHFGKLREQYDRVLTFAKSDSR